jgi:hypothetical protein
VDRCWIGARPVPGLDSTVTAPISPWGPATVYWNISTIYMLLCTFGKNKHVKMGFYIQYERMGMLFKLSFRHKYSHIFIQKVRRVCVYMVVRGEIVYLSLHGSQNRLGRYNLHVLFTTFPKDMANSSFDKDSASYYTRLEHSCIILGSVG